MAWKRSLTPKALDRDYYVCQLDRPARPALPQSYFWTWDHSTNWLLDDPGVQTSGCASPYLKRSGTFEEDYRRLTDLAAGLGIRGIVIWGFLRDAHGGVKAAKRVTAYARRKGVGIFPGIGVTAYNGIYYEGRNRFCLLEFLKRHPECRALNVDGTPREGTGCVAHPRFRQWFAEGMRWLFEEVGVDGVNLENGDFFVDHNPAMKALREQASWPADDTDTFFNQAMSYKLALDSVPVELRKVFASYATYSGFKPGEKPGLNGSMGTRPPAMLDILPKDAVCQWTLSGMLRDKPLPLTDYWDDGAPAAAFENPNWPVDLRPPGKRAVGFIHQGSQWWYASRYRLEVSAIKEGCLRAYRAGLEGVSIHGEVSLRQFAYAMNYLAFSHFTHWPEDSMREFGRKTLGQVLGKAKDGEDFALVLSHLDAGTMTPEIAALAHPERHGFPGPQWGKRADSMDAWQMGRLWVQLKGLADWAVHKSVVESTPDMPEPWNA